MLKLRITGFLEPECIAALRVLDKVMFKALENGRNQFCVEVKGKFCTIIVEF